MKFAVTPTDALADEPIRVIASELAPNQEITIRATMPDHGGRSWESWAAFRSDDRGHVDLTSATPVAGTYLEKDPNGLLWSMVLDPSVKERSRFDSSSPEPLTIQFEAEIAGRPQATARVTRRYIGPEIARIPVREGGLVATLFRQKDGACPAVIYLSGSGGGLPEGDAALLASRGFTVLSLAYFGIEALPHDLCEIPLEYFQKAIRWLGDHPATLAGRLAVMGRSKGGELALLLGAKFPEIKAVVAYVPSAVVWMGVGASPSCLLRSSWSYGSCPLPFVPAPASEANPFASSPIDLTRLYRAAMKNRAAMEAASIEIEKTNGPILMISGMEDQCWPSTELSGLAASRLEERGFPHFYEHVAYPGAGHLIEPCFRPTTVNEIFHPVVHLPLLLGGSAPANAAADVDSWKKVLTFLRDRL